MEQTIEFDTTVTFNELNVNESGTYLLSNISGYANEDTDFYLPISVTHPSVSFEHSDITTNGYYKMQLNGLTNKYEPHSAISSDYDLNVNVNPKTRITKIKTSLNSQDEYTLNDFENNYSGESLDVNINPGEVLLIIEDGDPSKYLIYVFSNSSSIKRGFSIPNNSKFITLSITSDNKIYFYDNKNQNIFNIYYKYIDDEIQKIELSTRKFLIV